MWSVKDYKIKVKVEEPNTPEGMTSGLYFDLDCHFTYNPETYGNGHYVQIKSTDLPFQCCNYDLRYDKSFDRNNKIKWLEEWARSYWSGENGSWKITELEIKKVL